MEKKEMTEQEKARVRAVVMYGWDPDYLPDDPDFRPEDWCELPVLALESKVDLFGPWWNDENE